MTRKRVSDDSPILATTAANMLGIHEQTARAWIRRGFLVGRQLGRHWYTSRAAVRALRASLGTPER